MVIIIMVVVIIIIVVVVVVKVTFKNIIQKTSYELFSLLSYRRNVTALQSSVRKQEWKI